MKIHTLFIFSSLSTVLAFKFVLKRKYRNPYNLNGTPKFHSFESNYEDNSKFSFLSILVENIVFNQTFSSFSKFVTDYRDDASKLWLEKFLINHVEETNWGKLLETMALCPSQVIPIRRSSPMLFFGDKQKISNNTVIEHSRLVEPRALASRLTAVRQDIINELLMDALASKPVLNKKFDSSNPANAIPPTPYREVGACILVENLLYMTFNAAKLTLDPMVRKNAAQTAVAIVDEQMGLMDDIRAAGVKARSRSSPDEAMPVLEGERSLLRLWRRLLASGTVPMDISATDESDSVFLSSCSSDLIRLLADIAQEVRASCEIVLQGLSADIPLFNAMIDRLGGSSLTPGPALSKPAITDDDRNSFRIVSPLEDKEGDGDGDGGDDVAEAEVAATISVPRRRPVSFGMRGTNSDSPSLIVTKNNNNDNDLSKGNGTTSSSSVGDNDNDSNDPPLPVSSGRSGLESQSPPGTNTRPDQPDTKKGWRVYGGIDGGNSGPTGTGNGDDGRETKPDTDGRMKRTVQLLDPPPRFPGPPEVRYNGPVDDEGDRSVPVDQDDVARGSIDDLMRALGPEIRIQVVGSMSDGTQLDDDNGNGNDLGQDMGQRLEGNSSNNNNNNRNHPPDYLCLEGIAPDGRRERRWDQEEDYAAEGISSPFHEPTNKKRHSSNILDNDFVENHVEMLYTVGS
eukprot:gene4895-9762_t